MTLPVSNNSISFSQLDAELNFATSNTININSARIRQLSNTSSGSSINIGSLRGKYYNWIRSVETSYTGGYPYPAITFNKTTKEMYICHAGVATGNAPTSDYDILIKYDKWGSPVWQKYMRPSDPWAGPRGYIGADTDSSGNYYVNYYNSQWHFTDTVYSDVTRIFKINSSGVVQWGKLLAAPGNTTYIGIYMRAKATSVDSSGNVYVTGPFFHRSPNTWGVAIFKFDSSGNVLWQKRIDYAEASGILVTKTMITSTGNLVISLYSGVTTPFYTQFFVLDSSGNIVSQFKTTTNSYGAYSLSLDSSDNIYISGPTSYADGSYQGAVTKLNTSGTIAWHRTTGNTVNYLNNPISVVDNSGNLYLTNRIGNDTYSYLTKFDTNGTKQFEMRTTQAFNGGGMALYAADNMGSIYSAITYGSAGSYRYSRFALIPDTGLKTGTYTVGDNIVFTPNTSVMTWSANTTATTTTAYSITSSSFPVAADDGLSYTTTYDTLSPSLTHSIVPMG